MIDAAADLADLIEMSKIEIASHLPMINL